ncbi:Mitochondrial chaperone Frataxin [Xylographa pallens]|nr:Mitochondrial chaperone Frataxin [Xylographa pallens]
MILRSHNGSAAKKQRTIHPEINGRFLSSSTAPVRCCSAKNHAAHTSKDVQARQSHARPNIQNSPTRYASSSAATAADGKATGYEGIKDPSEITQNKYNQLADDYLEAVQQCLEDLSDADENVEVEFSAGVLTVTLPPAGTYVINKQPPNKQIWLSSPVSGPKRYDYVSLNENGENGDWVYLRDGSTMTTLLTEEMGVILPEKEQS